MASQYDYSTDPFAAHEQDVTGQLLAAIMPPKKAQARLPMPGPVQVAATPSTSENQPARLPAPTAPVNRAQTAPQRPAGHATLGDYKNALQRATAAGDEEAIAHFQGAIDQVLKQPTDATGKPIPQGGSILNPIGQGLTLGFLDELAGVGGGLASAGRGALGLTPEGQTDGFWHGYDSIAGDIRQGDKEYAERNPVASMAAEIGSGLVMPLGILKTLGGGMRTALASGAVYGAGKAEGDIGDRVEGAATGAATGALGHGVVRALSGLGRAVFPAVATKAKGPEFKQQVRTLEDAGIPVTPAEKIASPQGRMAERMTGSYFNTGAKIEMRPQTLYSRLMARANFDPADVATGELSEDAVNRARQRFSADYSRALQGAKVKLPDMDPFMRRIEAGVQQLLPHEVMGAAKTAKRIIASFRQEIGNGRTISGTDYKRLRSNLGKQAARAARSDVANWTAPIYRALQANLDDAFRQGAHPSRVAALRKIDSKYGAYKILADAQANPEAIGTLANNAFRNKSRVDPVFVELARAYQNVLIRGYPQSSGTAENTVAKSIIPPVASIARATGAAGSSALRNLRLPEPVASHLQGAVPFATGQQAPGSDLEELVKMIGGLR